jgi:hypothetical protein
VPNRIPSDSQGAIVAIPRDVVTSRSKRRRAVAQTQVTIVSNRDETLDGLQGYLQRAGVAARGTRELQDALLEGANVTAIVLFPDDFAPADVEEIVRALARARPSVLPVLVTREPTRFQRLASTRGAQRPPVIIPKPAWGWTILDTVRGGLEA